VARRIPLGWALAGQAAAAAAVALFFMLPQARSERDEAYRLLAAEETRAAGNIIVMFAPDATERELRAALEQAGVRLADGPTANGAFLVRSPPRAPGGLQRLRGTEPGRARRTVDADAGREAHCGLVAR
jgi:hypothetical protein